MSDTPFNLRELDNAIAAQGRLRGKLPDLVVDVVIAALRAQRDCLAQRPKSTPPGAEGAGTGGGHSGAIGSGQQITAAEGVQIIEIETETETGVSAEVTAVDRQSALGRYLQHCIDQNRYLPLPGIRSGGKPVHLPLDRIYVNMRATRQRAQHAEAGWLAPGDTVQVTLNAALAGHKRLAVLGKPGSGKTTLLRYLALLYARDLAEDTQSVGEKLGLAESGWLPILLPLRQVGRYLAAHRPDYDGSEGPAILLRFLAQMLKNERIEVAATFFDQWLNGGRAAILLDGLDEVADPMLRRRVARLVEAFTRAYPDCRYVVASRIAAYTGAAQLNEGYAITAACDFSIDDVRAFLSRWHRLVAIGQRGPGEAAEVLAAGQTRQLLDAIDNNEHVRELAANPLLLTVIALIHRDRVKLPDRRAELYQEALDVLLGKWDEAHGLQEPLILNDHPLDISDRRLVLQHLALSMHEQATMEIGAEPLRRILARQLGDAVQDPHELDAAVARFLGFVQARSGLLIARAEGRFAFSHPSFQEYLAALAIAGRDDYLDCTLRRSADPWWREVILLEAGYLSGQSKEKTTRLISAIADSKTRPAPYHNLVLAAECLREAGANRILGDLESRLRARLQRKLDRPAATGLRGAAFRLVSGGNAAAITQGRIAAAEALGEIRGSRFWTPPHGEPEWVRIPQGEFTMGDPADAYRVHLPDYAISRAPITEAQYQLFVQATGHPAPEHWNGKRAPRGREIHPVVAVSWHDALAYCRWLSQATGKPVTLPSEAEWEKAARGKGNAREYPWGNAFDAARCNVWGSGFGDTTPVGLFSNSASPYGCLDMAGNVWEWTRSLWGEKPYPPDFCYPYRPEDPKREDLAAADDAYRIVRGGSWRYDRDLACCASRNMDRSGNRNHNIGFRVVLRSAPAS